MKTLIVSGALALVSLSVSADPTGVRNLPTYRANQNLQALFGEVENLEWKPAMNSMVRADFDQDGSSYSIFFKSDGELVATTRKVSEADLPFSLRKAVAAKFGKGNTHDAFELQNDEEHVWYFKATLKGKAGVWKGYDNGRIVEFIPKP